MRLLAGFFSLCFLFSTVDFTLPLPKKAVSAKTCCGRTICSCTHAKNAACPIKAALKIKPHCPMASKVEAAAAAPKKQHGPVFTKAPCHKDTPKTVLPGHPKDFQLPSDRGLPHPVRMESRAVSFNLPQKFFPDLSLDLPPRLSPLPA